MIAHRSDIPVLAIGFVHDFGFRENRKAAAGYHEGQLLADSVEKVGFLRLPQDG